MTLKLIFREAGITIAEAARHIDVSRSALSQIANRDIWPVSGAAEIKARLNDFLSARGLSVPSTEKKRPRRVRPRRGPDANPRYEETEEMVTHRVRITQAARTHFRLTRDPFQDCQDPADVWMSTDIRYVREAMWSTARHGGFVGIVGESGAGKSTLREELLERLQREQQPVIVVQPYIIAMEERDQVGKTLRSQHIAEAVVRTVAPTAKPCSSPEARFHQLHEVLRASSRTGMRHLLIIEEAHAMPTATLVHLKRWLELKDGMRPLVSILLIAQPELLKKLTGAAVREVAQRLELVQLAPLGTGLRDYLSHRISRAGSSLEALLEPAAVDAISAVLKDVYPLALHNLLSRAINTAASLGAPKVTADMVREGGR